ncbi:MAG: aromatic-L-amino-acid decarboxylase [Phycisphaeraceae bacterium]|nr:MAG: aromatic-L-amino-acid decarboxylase [Phycisphaeraceae bacterium]
MGADAHNPGHMSPDAFRREGHRLIDWIADYWESLEERPVVGDTKPGDVLKALPTSAPESPGGEREWDDIVRDLDAVIAPNLTHWQSPRFFAYFPCNGSGPGVLGELVSAGLGVNGMLWSTSPAATELETRMLDWCADLHALPEAFKSTGAGGGVIQGTASEAAVCALVAARKRAGGDPRTLAVACSEQAHSSIAKAAMVAGLADGPEDATHIRLVRTGPEGAMDPVHLREQLRTIDGVRPAMVVGTLGTTSTGAFDRIDDIPRAIADAGLDRERVWVHIDAAWAGSAFVCPEHRGPMAGIEHADSVCINPHKWGLVTFDCDLFWVRDRRALTDALSITPEYLRNEATDAGAVIDYRDWQVPLGRRMRALKLWFVLRHYGAQGLRAHIRRGVELAAAFESWVRADERFEVPVDRSLGLVCFRLRAGDDASERLLRELNRRGRVLVSHTRVPVGEGRAETYLIRFAVGATLTERRHVVEAWDEIRAAADAVLG